MIGFVKRLGSCSSFFVCSLVSVILFHPDYSWSSETTTVTLNVGLQLEDYCSFTLKGDASNRVVSRNLTSVGDSGAASEQEVFSFDYYCNKSWEVDFEATDGRSMSTSSNAYLVHSSSAASLNVANDFEDHIEYAVKFEAKSEDGSSAAYSCSQFPVGNVYSGLRSCSGNLGGVVDPSSSNVPISGSASVYVKIPSEYGQSGVISNLLSGNYDGTLSVEIKAVI